MVAVCRLDYQKVAKQKKVLLAIFKDSMKKLLTKHYYIFL